MALEGIDNIMCITRTSYKKIFAVRGEREGGHIYRAWRIADERQCRILESDGEKWCAIKLRVIVKKYSRVVVDCHGENEA